MFTHRLPALAEEQEANLSFLLLYIKVNSRARME